MADDTTTDTAPPLTVHKKATPAPTPNAQQGGRNWIRVCRLIASDNTGSKTLDLSGLRIRFQTTSYTTQAPSVANIVVSNVSRATFARFQKEFTKVSLFCGYEGSSPGLIFSGTVTVTTYGEKEGMTDTLLRITARDGDRGYNHAVLAKTLSAGWTHQDVVDECLKTWKPYGIEMGQVLGVDLASRKFPRAITLSQMARDHMRDLALSNRATWNLNGGRLNIIHKDSPGSGGPIVLNSSTGLINQPIEQTQGVMARCLINAAITVDSQVQLDQKSIIQTQVNDVNVDPSGGDSALRAELGALGATDGRFRVLAVSCEGDTRGPPWYMDLTMRGAITGKENLTQQGMWLS